MKKLLTILGAIGLTATASSAVVSCSNKETNKTNKEESEKIIEEINPIKDELQKEIDELVNKEKELNEELTKLLKEKDLYEEKINSLNKELIETKESENLSRKTQLDNELENLEKKNLEIDKLNEEINQREEYSDVFRNEMERCEKLLRTLPNGPEKEKEEHNRNIAAIGLIGVRIQIQDMEKELNVLNEQLETIRRNIIEFSNEDGWKDSHKIKTITNDILETNNLLSNTKENISNKTLEISKVKTLIEHKNEQLSLFI